MSESSPANATGSSEDELAELLLAELEEQEQEVSCAVTQQQMAAELPPSKRPRIGTSTSFHTFE